MTALVAMATRSVHEKTLPWDPPKVHPRQGRNREEAVCAAKDALVGPTCQRRNLEPSESLRC